MTVLAPYIVALTLLYLGICAWVVKLRRAHGVGIGHGERHDLKRAIRVHANFTENVPLAMLLLVLASQTAAPVMIHVLGGGLLVFRIFHLMGLGRNPGVSFGRFWGAGGTWLVMGVAAGLLLT